MHTGSVNFLGCMVDAVTRNATNRCKDTVDVLPNRVGPWSVQCTTPSLYLSDHHIDLIGRKRQPVGVVLHDVVRIVIEPLRPVRKAHSEEVRIGASAASTAGVNIKIL